MPAPDETPSEEEIFQIAAALPVAEREAYLRSACAGDPEARAAVERLLASVDDEAFMQRSVDRTASTELEAEFARLKPEEAGEVIGNYKLLQKIGEGGFGIVWMAEQEKPVRRRVALKIIKLGMDTKEVIARFEQERQALAIMEHPNIAKVLDAGATPFGRPFFAMELVRGVKITEYCDQANLPTADRLQLFIAVCHAVQHAHQKGIIHRDLKPSNILVTLHDGVPVPKVIDFGVAKATQQQRLTDLTLFTQFEQMVGTPLYMSPEQAELSGLDIDTRSDIYSLGVLLYELLTGRTPFDPEALMRAGLDEIRRVIREEEPQKPSTFVSTMAVDLRTNVAQHRQADSAKLVGQIRGDLDWIVMKALEKDRNRRYETANGLAKDIERHLASEPVLARPPSQLYRFRRFAKRNRLAFTASLAVAAAILIGLAVSIWQAARANRALAELRTSAPAFAAQARGLAGRERFDEAIEKLEYAIKLRPDVVDYLLAKADLLECQFRFAEAAPVYRAAMRLSPGDRAQRNVALCEKLRAEQAAGPQLARESLVQLLDAMAREHRPAAEMIPVGRLLGEEKKLALATWLERLKDLPIQPKRPLEQLLTMRDDGTLDLDLSGTPVADLSVLEGMPLGGLSLADCDDLSDLRPLAGLPIKSLNLKGTRISDLGPLRTTQTLFILNLAETKVEDLSPLKGLPLRQLYLTKTRVADLAPLRGMPLETLYLDSTPVSDLSPLAEMSQLHVLGCTAIPASDFSPLGRKPIETLNIQHTRVGDLSFLKGMPLKTLILNGCGLARGFQVLNEIKTLETLFLPALPLNLSQETMKEIDTLRQHPTLRQIERGVTMDGMDTRTAQSTEEFWKKWDADTRLAHAVWQAGVKTFEMRRLEDGTLYLGFWGRPLRDLGVLRGEPVSELGLDGTLVTDFTPLAEMPLRKLLVRETSVSDLSFLRASLCGSTIEELWLWRTKVADLSPIAQCAALKMLDLHSTPVMDLAPLRGLNLRELRLGSTRVSDLSPLVGMPLEKLYLEKTDVTDIAPLLTCPTLEYIVLPAGAQNVTALRALPNLQKISYQGKDSGPSLTADEFWANQEIESEKVQIWKYERLIADSLKLGRREKLMELVRESHADFLREDANAKPPLATTALTKRFKVSALALFLGDRTTYQAVCSELARDSRGTTDAYAASFAAKTLLLSPDSGVAPALVTQLMRVVKSGPGISNMNDFEPWGLLLKMFASYRSGDFPAAISAGALLAKHPTALPEAKTAGAAVMAMARQRQGDAIQAAVDLKVARESMLDGWEKEADRVWWWDWMIASVLIREAAQLVEGGSQSAK